MDHIDLEWTEQHDLSELTDEQLLARWNHLARVTAAIAYTIAYTSYTPTDEHLEWIILCEKAREAAAIAYTIAYTSYTPTDEHLEWIIQCEKAREAYTARVTTTSNNEPQAVEVIASLIERDR